MSNRKIHTYLFFLANMLPLVTIALQSIFTAFGFPVAIITKGNIIRICDTIPALFVTIPLAGITLISGTTLLFTLKGRFFRRSILFVLVCIGIFFSLYVLVGSLHSVRVKSYNQKRIGDLKSISLAQELHYDYYGNYASTFADLKGLYFGDIFDPQTHLEYVDADGYGLEGGDNDPSTWSIQTYIEETQYKSCIIKSRGHLYICSQDGCSNLD